MEEFTLEELNAPAPVQSGDEDGFTLDELNGNTTDSESEIQSNVPGLTEAIKAQDTDEAREGIRVAGLYADGLAGGDGKKYLGREGDEDVFEYDAENAPAFAPQDDAGRAVHARVKAHKGGTLNHFDRPMRINRGKDGKAESYSTTESTVVEELDGTYSVIPTMWKGENGDIESAIDDKDAASHYRETERGKVGQKVGERFGNFKTREEAKAAAKDIHELHQKAYQQKWNQWINEHWDEVSDEIKNDPGMAKAHEDWEKAGKPGIRFGMKVNDGERVEREKKVEPMGALEKLQMELQQRTGKRYTKGGALLYTYAPFISKSEALDANVRTAAREVLRSGDYTDEEAKEIAGVAGIGGEYDEIMRMTAGGQEKRRRDFLKMAAEDALREETQIKAEAAENLEKRPLTGLAEVASGPVDWLAHAASGISEFALAGPMMIPMSATESYQNTVSTAIANGKSRKEAEALGGVSALVDGAMTAAFYAAPFRRWANGKNITPVQRVSDTSFSEMKRGMGRYFAKQEAINQVIAGVEAGGIMGVQGAADTAIGQLAQGQDIDLGEITVNGLKGVRDGVLIGAILGGARTVNARIKGAKEYERIVRNAIKTPQGARAFAEINVDAMADFLEPFEKGSVADAKQADRAGLPPMSIQDRGRFAALLRAQGITSEMLRKGAAEARRNAEDSFWKDQFKQIGVGGDDASGLPKESTPTPKPPSESLADKIQGEFGVAPVKFEMPQTPDGKPYLGVFEWRENATGKTGRNELAYDPNTKVTIMKNADGSFTVKNNTGDEDDAATMDEAVEKAKMLALMGQYTELDRQRKKQVIENERAEKYGKKNVIYFNTMADAAAAFENGIAQDKTNGGEGKFFGVNDPSQLRNPTVQGYDAFHTPDGTTVVILDNVQEVGDIPRILGHEIVGHGGANAEFGGSRGAQIVFAENIRAKEFDDFKQQIVDGLFPKLKVKTDDKSLAMETVNKHLGEVFAHYASVNLDKEPSTLDKLVSLVNSAARKLKLRKTYSSADVKTMMAKWRAAASGEGGQAIDLSDSSPRFEFFPVEEQAKTTEVKDETRTGADEAPAEPEQGAERPSEVEAPRSVEGEPQGAEAPRSGVVEAKNETAVSSTGTLENKQQNAEISRKSVQKPVAERNIVEKLTDQAPVQELPIDEVFNDDSRIPNFKEGANPETGEVEPLTGEPYDLVSNPIVVMEFKDGKKVVVTGRHRLALYKRSGRKTIAARVIREADGWTVDDAKAIDAIGNIIDEKGTVKDYVNYFNNAKPTREEAKAGGFLDRPKGQRAFSIFEGATEATKAVIDWNGTGGDGLISVDQAGIIAESAPKDENKRFGAVQRILVQKALAGLRGKKLGILARSLAEEAKTRKETPNVGGEMQLDLFTSEEDQKLLSLEEKRSDYRVKKAEEYGRIAEILRTALAKGGKLDLNADYAKELGITDTTDRKQLAAARDKAVERANYWENSIRLEDADKTAMDAEIGAAADARAKKLAELKAKREAAKSGNPAPKVETKPKAEIKQKAEARKTVVHQGEEVVVPKVQDKPHLDIALANKRIGKAADALSDGDKKKEKIKRQIDKIDSALQDGDLSEDKTVREIANALHRLKDLVLDVETGEAKEGLEKIVRHIEKIESVLSDRGFVIVDPIGSRFDGGDAVKVIAFEGEGENEFYKETLVPTIRKTMPDGKTRLVQMAEVIVGRSGNVENAPASAPRAELPKTASGSRKFFEDNVGKRIIGKGGIEGVLNGVTDEGGTAEVSLTIDGEEHTISVSGAMSRMASGEWKIADKEPSEKAPVSAPSERGTTTPPKATKAPEGEKTGDTAAQKREPSIRMKDAAAEKKAKDALDAIDFDSLELTPPGDYQVISLEAPPTKRVDDLVALAERNGIIGRMTPIETGGKGAVNISKNSIREMLNPSQVKKSVSPEAHFAVVEKLRDVIRVSHIEEIHPDYKKGPNGEREPANGINPGVTINVAYAAVTFGGQAMRAKITLKSFSDANTSTRAYAYQVAQIEVLTGNLANPENGTGPHANTSIGRDIILNGVLDVNGKPLLARPKQGELSGGTSINQNPAGNNYGKKWKIFRPGTRNVDIGAGRFDKATQFLEELGVTNLPFDPVNRTRVENEAAAQAVRDNPADTATVHNVLNVIDNDAVMEGIINQAARAIKKNGTAIFTIYEGDGSGNGRVTRAGYQRNAKTAAYLPAMRKYFDHVEAHGHVVLAKQPKDVGPAFWAYDSQFEDGISFDTTGFDPENFGKLVTGVGKLVDVLVDSGHKDFKSLATYIYERDAAKFERAKPVLQDIWNAVARSRGLKRVSDEQTDEIYGIIESENKEAANGPGGEHGDNGGVRAADEGRERPGGVLAGGQVRSENPDERVGSVGAGDVSGQVHAVAESGVQKEEPAGAGEAAGRSESVADSAGHERGEQPSGRDSSEDGSHPAAGVKKQSEEAADKTKVNPQRRDFVMTKAVEDAILETGTANRVRNNLAAIKLIRELKSRDYAATPEEQETLAKFVGWGGLREAVFGFSLERAYDMERSGDVDGAMRYLRRNGISKSAYDLHKELRQVLNDNEYNSAKESASTAFYTPVNFVRALHDALRMIGVKGGRFLGPSAGIGHFASAEGEYEKPVNWQFVEKDTMTGEILKALFPNQRVTIGGFEETKFPDGFFDIAIDNVPYADVPISDRSVSSRMFKIHDYFFAKTLAKLRPGGVMAFLTSTGTLDKTSPILRQYLTEHGGKIVGAVRLPNGFFSENAGTDAASDLVIVQKVEGRPDNSAFERGEQYGTTTQYVPRKGQVQKPLTYNGYFKDHPEQVVGKMEVASGRFGPTLKFTMPENADEMLTSIRGAIERALDGIDKDALLKSATVAEPKARTPIYDDEGLRQGNVTMKDGKPFIKSGEMLEPISLPSDRGLSKELAKRLRTPKQVMEGLIGLRKAMRDVIDAQMEEDDRTEIDLEPLWAKLNEVYDAFVKKNGTLHDKWISPFVLLDKADGNRMLALERIVKDENGKPKVVKSDIFSKRVISRGQRATKAETPSDALVISYSETGAINIPRIAELLGVNQDAAIEKLKESGAAFENPQTGRLEPSWEYLSGRVRAKLAAARAAVDAGEESYSANVEALEKVQPPMVRLEEAEVKFGATWVDPECMKDFLREAFGSEHMGISLGKNEVTGDWNIEFGRVLNEDPWGETSWSPMEFVKRVLNHGSMNAYITDPVDKKRYLDERQTEANKLAAEKMHQAFSQFIQSSEKWAEQSYERYNAVMTDMVEIKLPNNILPYRSAGMSEDALNKIFEDGDPNKPKKGREYQSAVIARGVLGGGSLCLAHCVGAGKTLEMQSIGVLGRHLGLFKKPMYVVPNHMLEQFTNEFMEAFPNANILKMSEDDVKPANRRAFFAQVANGDWDAIVVKHSTFSKKLGMSEAYQKKFIEAQIADLEAAIEAMRESGDRISVNQATKKKESLEAKLEQLANAENHDSQIVPFEELGVDQLFVDEAHNFKGMPITTRQWRTGGLSQGDSQRAVDMQMKTQYVQSLHGGDRGVVFATGTPLSNAPVVEAYVMLKYLAPKKLEEQGLSHFDDFVAAFGRITTESEFSLDGKTVKEKEKVSAFVNIPELMKLLRSAVDIVNPDQLDIPRPKPKYHMIDVDMTPAQVAIMEMVAREAATPPSREERNKYLTLTRIAKNACLTPRLLGYEDGGNKIIRAVAEIKKVYDETAANRGAQLVFTDIFNRAGAGTDDYLAEHLQGEDDGMLRSDKDYNLNEEIRDLLVAAGVPKGEIAIIQDIDKSKGDKDANKGALFAKVRSGDVRILIGSRPKMGEGTNVQERLAAIHLLHPGWKPAEDEQAIGRIIRFGNTYKEGQIFYYLTKGNANIGSYETKNHQLIGVKSKLIDQVMHGDETIREIDMDESAMDRDMLMGLASGNKALMELIDVKKRVHKLELNTESTASSARRIKDRAEANARILERKRDEFEETQKGVKEWRDKNDGKPFALSTPDGRTIDKMKDMADYVAAQMVKQLTKERYDRDEITPLGEFNGVELVLAYDRWGDEKFKIAVPLLGIEREINYSGFIPDFSPAAMTAFKGRIFETVSPDFAEAQKAAFADMETQAKKMLSDAEKLQKDYEGMRDELIKMRKRQAELEREVTPLMVQAVEDRNVATYGNWFIQKANGEYTAQRDKDGMVVSAKTVKKLIPLMDAEDFAHPQNAATKTTDLQPHLKPDRKGVTPHVQSIPVGEVDFDSPALGVPYQGSKSRIARSIVNILPSGRRFVDLFSGGGAMTHAAMLSGKFGEYHMNDLNPNGQRLFLGGLRGEYEGYEKRDITQEEFAKIKGTPEALMLSFNGLGRSLAGVDDTGRDKAQEQINRVKRLSALGDMAGSVTYSETDYRNVELRPGDVVYADIPYEETDQRGYGGGKFNKSAFLDWAYRQDVPVFVSEYGMPQSGWREVSSFDVPGMRGGTRTEKLFVQEKFADEIVFDTPELVADLGNQTITPVVGPMEYVIHVTGPNVDERVPTTATSAGKASSNAKFRAAKGRNWLIDQLDAMVVEAGGFPLKVKSGIMPTDENDRKIRIAVARKRAGLSTSGSSGQAGGSNGAADGRGNNSGGAGNSIDARGVAGELGGGVRTGTPGTQAANGAGSVGFATGDTSGRGGPNGGEMVQGTLFDVTDFDTPELTPAEAEYAAAEDKTPTEKVMREVYGMTNDEIATALRAAGIEPPAHVRKPDATMWQQAEALLSNPSYMAKLSRAVARVPRPIRDYENVALNVLLRQRQADVNAAQVGADGLKETLDDFNAIPKDERDAEWTAEQQITAKNYAEANMKLAQAKALMFETGKAAMLGASEQGRALRSNRALIDQTDYSYAGIAGQIADIAGGADKITPEMDAKIREIAKLFEGLDSEQARLATERLKPLAEKIVTQTKNGLKVRKAAERKPGDEAKRVLRNYQSALDQIEVGAAEVGGTLVGLSDQQYPSWGKWLRAIGEYHCFENPEITEEQVIKAIVEDISPFMDGVDENQVRDALTGFGHNFRQSRYEAQRLMNDLRSQSRMKRQIDWMDENNTMPPLTGMVRDEPSDVTRNLQKQVQERKKEVPDAGRDERRLKGVLESAKTRVKNRIADLEHAIETGERIPAAKRSVPEDIELRALKQRKAELQKAYDELFKTERGMTEEQRVKLAEKLLGKELEHALEDLDRARSGDFSKREKRPAATSPTIDALRDKLNEVREQIRELKKAKYEFGMTPEELSAYNARKIANREKAVARLAERIVSGDIRPQKKPQPPMTKDEKKRYDMLGEQMNRAHRKLADLRREAADARKPAFVRFIGDAYRFVDGVWKMATASLDFTQVGNQTGTILMAHPKIVAENFAKTLKAFASQTNADNIEVDLLSDPSVKEAVENGWLHWKRISDSSNRGERVELFDAIDKPFTIGGKAIRFTDIPIYGKAIANSDRLYATYINAASASLYSTIINDPKLFPGGATVFQKKMLCDMINVMNGSGSLSKGARRYVGKVLWAPGLVDSQLKRLIGYQIWHPWTASAEADGSGTFKERVKMSRIGLGEFVRSNIGALLLGSLLLSLFATDDQKDEFSKASPIRKLAMLVAPRLRHTQFDFTGGSVAFLRLGMKLATGAYEGSTGKTVHVRDTFSEVAHFAKGRLTPLISNLFSWLSGKDYTGQDYGASELLLSFAPISIREAGKSFYENGIEDRAWVTAFIGATLTMFGIGKGTYRKDDYKILSNRFLEDKKEFDKIENDDLLDDAERKKLLDDMRSSNLLMRDNVRNDIAADIARIRKDEARVKKDEKLGYEPDAFLISEIEREKAALIEKIRSARRE